MLNLVGNVVATLLFTGLVLYGLAMVGIIWVSAHPPRVPHFTSPGFLGQPQENVEFVTSDGICLRGWYTASTSPRFIVVYAHGYLMNRCEPVGLAIRLARMGGAGLLFDLRAQGQSDGKRVGLGYTEAADVRAAVAWARARSPGVPVVLWGSSMGGAACLFAAASDAIAVDGVMIDSGFGRLTVAMRGWWPFFVGPFWARFIAPSNGLARWLMPVPPSRVDTCDALPKLGATPLLLLYGDRDPIVPVSEVARMVAAAHPSAQLVWFPGRGHSEARWHDPERYFAAVEAWLAEWLCAMEANSGNDSDLSP